MSLIMLEGVNKVYSSGEESFQALKNIDLKLNKGDFLAIVGPSGSGKTTLMNILGLLDSPSSGKYLLDEQNVATLKENTLARIRNQKIGFVFQDFNLLNRTSALDNVALPLIYAGANLADRRARARQELEAVHLGDKLNNLPNQLSGGQQQRVAIARSLVNNPDVILADEPTGNLDSKTGDEILTLFKSLNRQGKTIVIITHSPEIARSAKHEIHLKDGKIIKNI